MKNSSMAGESLAQLQNVKTLTVVGALLAVKVILDILTIQITPSLHLSFEFLAEGIAGMLYGPVVGIIYGMVGDILCYLMNPKGTYFIGFTLIAMVSGCINGGILYKRKPTVKRVISARIINIIICNMILNTLCLVALYSTGILAMVPLRIFKNLILLPLEVMVMYWVVNKVFVIERQGTKR